MCIHISESISAYRDQVTKNNEREILREVKRRNVNGHWHGRT